MFQYAIYASPTWATPSVPYAVVAWLLDVDEDGKKSSQPMPAEGFLTLEQARAAVPNDHGGRVCVAPDPVQDEPDLVEVWV